MIRIILSIILIGGSAWLHAQEGIDRVISEIEKNNTTLQALAQQMKAGKLMTRVGIYPDNPEMGFGFLKGTPSILGNRTDFEIKQALDFPVAYFHKNRLAKERGSQLDWEFQKQRRALLLEARLICLDLVYANAQHKELIQRSAYARDLAAAIETKYSRGEANILELNKARLNLLNIQKEAEGNGIERHALSAELARLNGGMEIELQDDGFPDDPLSEDFKIWYGRIEQNNPELQWLRKEIESLETQLKLDRALNLPKLSIGYRSESVTGERYQGITAGISIPLFERKNTVRYDKANIEAIRGVEADGRLQFFNRMKAQHERVVALRQSARDYRLRLPELDNTPLLKKALDKGELSVIEYVLEVSMYYDSVMRLLQAERDYAKALAVLNQYNPGNR